MKASSHTTPDSDIQDFHPQDPERVTDVRLRPDRLQLLIHIGNARPAVVFGHSLARLLRRRYARVVFARNITDVDDKINDAAAKAGVPISAITDRRAQAYPRRHRAARCRSAGCRTACDRRISPTSSRYASGRSRAATRTPPRVMYCSTSSYADYGHLSGRSVEDMIAGACRSGAVQEEPGRLRAMEAVDAGAAGLGTARGDAAVRAGISNARR